jgi:hypothetical protein
MGAFERPFRAAKVDISLSSLSNCLHDFGQEHAAAREPDGRFLYVRI